MAAKAPSGQPEVQLKSMDKAVVSPDSSTKARSPHLGVGSQGPNPSPRAKPRSAADSLKSPSKDYIRSPSKEKPHHHHQHHHRGQYRQQKLGLCMRLLPWLCFAVLLLIGLVLLCSAIFPGLILICPEPIQRLPPHCVKLEKDPVRHEWISGAQELNCWKAPQASPVVAHRVDNVKYAFFLSLIDIGASRYNLNMNVKRLLNGKSFIKPESSSAMQSVLETLIDSKAVRPDSIVVDVGAGIGEATFAAAAMGFRVTALEPVFANALRLCDGVYLNRADELVRVHLAAASDTSGNITVLNLMANLEHSAISRAAIALASRDAAVVPTSVEALTLDSLILPTQHVAVLKVSVQGWELHALRGATALLARPAKEAPFLLYEEDRILLRASNTTPADIRKFLGSFGYTSCELSQGLRHCKKPGSLVDS